MIAAAMTPAVTRSIHAHTVPRPRGVASASLRASAPALLATVLLWAVLVLVATVSRASAAEPARDATPADRPAAAATVSVDARALAPFSADYVAFRGGEVIGSARLHLVQVVQGPDRRWRIDLSVRADRGVAGLLGLDLQQSTVFEDHAGGWRPLSQSSVRKGLFLGKRSSGRYDWAAGSAQWTGDLKPRHRAPVALHAGDLSGLLINLAIVRDAMPGRELQYRFVESGRARDHHYRVADVLERVIVDDLSYAAMRVERSNGGNDQTVVWVAEGVPTPVRILQREDGEDLFDLRLIAYQGV